MILIVVFAITSRIAAMPSDASVDAQWISQRYAEVMSAVFGPTVSVSGLDPGTDWVLTIRIRSAYDEPELQLTLHKFHESNPVASLVRLKAPLRQQLSALYPSNATAETQVLAKKIAAERWELDKEAHVLNCVIREFESIRTTVILENYVIMDAREYEFWLDAGAQQSHWHVIGAADGTSKHPLIVWIEQTVKQLARLRSPRRSAVAD